MPASVSARTSLTKPTIAATEARFSFGLERLLDGLATLLEEPGSAARSEGTAR
ncbi:hypothetical protein ACFWAR_39100 [Streptomyces sp. NPDC059917]|uniref:hypothetical protein n=1 Tax=Streptomyces sp. NPDC059917 TaxID=3347002 RepID=UPI003656122C